MALKLIAFGITKELLGGREVLYPCQPPMTVEQLLQQLEQDYPGLRGLASLKVAINDEYARPGQLIQAQDEVVLIPPVSGG